MDGIDGTDGIDGGGAEEEASTGGGGRKSPDAFGIWCSGHINDSRCSLRSRHILERSEVMNPNECPAFDSMTNSPVNYER